MQRIDGVMFDMDGTLWDAVDTYTRVWDAVMAEHGIHRSAVTRRELIDLMGAPMDRIVHTVVPAEVDMPSFLDDVDRYEDMLIRRHGAQVYPGVLEAIPELARRSTLFLVSNCSRHGLENFMDITGTRPYMAEALSFGSTGLSKADNIRHLVEKYRLDNPLYVGDTAGDEEASHRAGVAFAWAAYGFGNASKPEYTLRTFADLLEIVR